jgi:hypothetical protein
MYCAAFTSLPSARKLTEHRYQNQCVPIAKPQNGLYNKNRCSAMSLARCRCKVVMSECYTKTNGQRSEIERFNKMENEKMGGKTCNCTHHKVIPILVILLGLEFLLANMGVFTWGFVSVTWPILVIIGGCVKLFGRNCKCCSK